MVLDVLELEVLEVAELIFELDFERIELGDVILVDVRLYLRSSLNDDWPEKVRHYYLLVLFDSHLNLDEKWVGQFRNSYE